MSDLVLVPAEFIEGKILFMRGKKVMLDRDLATLYEVETKVLNQAVKRNVKRFPADFMFQLTQIEAKSLKSQFVTSNVGRGGIRKFPFVFTEQGVAMLSTVLKSERAIMVNIQIMRTFTRLREMLITNEKLRRKLDEIEKKYDGQFKVIFDIMQRLLKEEESPKRRIGFSMD